MHSEQENNSFPAEFLERMKEMLGEEYPAFFESLGQERQQSFRINTGKTSVSGFLQQTDWKLKPVPWCETGFLLWKRDSSGKTSLSQCRCVLYSGAVGNGTGRMS